MSFEGPDGAGKTSVLKQLIPQLKEQTAPTLLLTREPGGDPISEAIRDVILDVKNVDMDARTEALLYAAARRQHLAETVLPALSQGDTVISDRFVDSSIAYQGAGRQIGTQAVADLNQFATDGLTPALTIYLDVPVKLGLERIQTQRQDDYDRLDREQVDFHERVHQAYLEIAKNNPNRVVTVDATQPLVQVVADCLQVIKTHYPQIFERK